MGHSGNTVTENRESIETQDKPENNATHMTPSFQALIMVAIIITAILEHIAIYVKEIPRIAKRTVQAVESMTMKASRNKFLQNIKDSYRTAALVITIATCMTDHTKHMKQLQKPTRTAQIPPGMRKLSNKYDGSYQSHTSRTYNNNSN